MKRKQRFNFDIVILLTAIITIQLISCKKGNEHDRNVAINSNIFQIDLAKAQKVPLSSLIDSISFIQLETNESCPISGIWKLSFFQDKIVIFDNGPINKKLFIFSKNGKYLNQFPPKGRGPGESIRLADFQIDTVMQKIYLLDTDLNKTMVYSMDGQFLEEYKIQNSPEYYFAKDSSDFYFYSPPVLREKEDMFQLIKTDCKFQVRKKYLPYDKTINGLLMLSSISPFQCYNNRIQFLPPYHNKVYEMQNDSLTIKYEFNFGKYWMKENIFFETSLEELRANLEKADCGVFSLGFLENDQNIYLSFFHYKSKFYEFLYDKKTNKSILIKRGDAGTTILRSPIGTRNNEFIFILSPINFDKLLKEDEDLLIKFDSFKELKASLNEEANPVIMCVKFKSINTDGEN